LLLLFYCRVAPSRLKSIKLQASPKQTKKHGFMKTVGSLRASTSGAAAVASLEERERQVEARERECDRREGMLAAHQEMMFSAIKVKREKLH
jgi:hypothetical protein